MDAPVTEDGPFVCECGAIEGSDLRYADGTEWPHRSEAHWRALFDAYTPQKWAELLACVENGLAWAGNESMGMGDDEETMALLRLALAEKLREREG